MIPRILLSFILITSILLPAVGQQPQAQPSPEPQKPATAQQTTSPEIDSQDVVRITTNLVQVTDANQKEPRVASQWIDFEIVK